MSSWFLVVCHLADWIECLDAGIEPGGFEI